MTMSIAFSILSGVGAALAVAFSDTRKVILCSWIAAMSLGALFLTFGAEYLAVVQWIVATLVAISFLIFATMYGEYGDADARTRKEKIFDAVPALIVGAVFFWMIWQATSALSLSATPDVGPALSSDLKGVGQALGERHLLALEMTGFMFLAALVGAGVISRAENSEDCDPERLEELEGRQ